MIFDVCIVGVPLRVVGFRVRLQVVVFGSWASCSSDSLGCTGSIVLVVGFGV